MADTDLRRRPPPSPPSSKRHIPLTPHLVVACLGAAAITRKTAPAILAAGHSIKYVSSRSLERAQAVVDACGLAAGGTTALGGGHAAALGDPAVTAVYIPAPAAAHVPLVQAAAAAGKHILLEKPIAISAEDLDAIVAAVKGAGVVLYDGTMWQHHPRAHKLASSLPSLGPLRSVHATLAFYGGPRFEESDIRTKPDADGLGCVGDLGWYCVRAGLWAFGGGRVDPADPGATATAHAGTVLNAAGVPLTAGATVVWPDGRYLSFDTSFQRAPAQRLEIAGTMGAAALTDFVLPDAAVGPAAFTVAAPAGAGDPDALPDVNPLTRVVTVEAAEPQEVGLWRAFGAAVAESAAGDTTRADAALEAAVATQRVLNAVMASIRAGGATVPVV
jgi:predicted dehydrogenase